MARPNLRSVASWQVFVIVYLLVIAALFYVPALARTGDVWPAPLDDVYIYFGFARSLAQGDPFTWFVGNGASSGATSVLYPWLLAPFWVLGLKKSALGIGAAIIALVCLFDLANCLRKLLRSRLARWMVAPMMLAIPLVDYSWFSGMETALFAATLGRALLATQRALRCEQPGRRQAQYKAGLWLSLMVLTRPESLALAWACGIAVAHAGRSTSVARSLWRSLGPVAITLAAHATLNHLLTGEWAQAGALRKLIWSTPYTDITAGIVAVLINVVVLVHQAFVRALGGFAGVLATTALVIAAVAPRRTRRLSLALVVGAVGALVAVSLNNTARFQNYRYAVPMLSMWLSAMLLGVDALICKPQWRPIGVIAGAIAIIAPARNFARETEHFATASQNIWQMHGEVARRLSNRRPRPRRILLSDAGAIPYLSEIPPLDGFGLGGFRTLPFARASVHGLPAVVELIERLPSGDRPDLMALFPGLWRGVADVFGTRIDAVRIENNVICAANEKVIYRADWNTLAAFDERRTGQVDELDTGDIISERDHDYRFPAPHGGWMIGVRSMTPDGAYRYDAGRIIPKGSSESFSVRQDLRAGPATLVLRTDAAARLAIRVGRHGRGDSRQDLHVSSDRGSGWIELSVTLDDIRGRDRITIDALDGPWRSFHAWLVREAPR